MDWTNSFDQKEINEFSNNVTNYFLDELTNLKLSHHSELNLSRKEIELIYRRSLSLSISTFTERLLRTICNNKQFQKINLTKDKLIIKRYACLIEATLNYYNNEELNRHYMEKLQSVIFNSGITQDIENIFYKPNIYNKEKNKIKLINKKFAKVKIFLVFYLKAFYKKLILLFYKPNYLYDSTKQLDLIFSHHTKFLHYPFFYVHNIDEVSRSKIRNIAEKIFKNKYSKFLNDDDGFKEKLISELFAYWIESSIPFSLLETLKNRYYYYQKFIKLIKIKYFHANTGFIHNENIKIFCVLAKRKNIKIIGHEHGANNFIVAGKNNFMSHYDSIDQFLFCDHFMGWGKDKVSDKWVNIKRDYNTQIHELGSVYLNSLKLNNKAKRIKNSFLILYCASQFRKYMTNLEQMTPEKNYIHKKNVAVFLKKIININSRIKIIYKPFPENTKNKSSDPIYEKMSNEIDLKKIEITNEESTKIMKKSDLVIFDLISTGFVEALNIGKPSIVFSNKFENSRASEKGRQINDILCKNGIIFYNDKEGINTVKRVLSNYNRFQEDTKDCIDIVKNNLGHPITKIRFLEKSKIYQQ